MSGGQTADLAIQVDATSGLAANGVEAHLNFNPAVLEVLDIGHATGPITPGGAFLASSDGPGFAGSTGDWTDVLQNARDNTAGEAHFAGGKGTSGTDAIGTFVLATVQFRAKAASTGTPVTFGTDTTVTSGTENVTGDTTGATLSVASPGCAPPESGAGPFKVRAL